MKKTITKLTLIPLIGVAIILTGCQSNPSSSLTPSEDTTSSEQVLSIVKTKIVSLPTKVDYFVGDSFDATGLKVNFVTYTNGEITNEIETNDYTLSLPEGSILEEGEHEIYVLPNDKTIRSASFLINVKTKEIAKTLIEIVNEIVASNNYTVTNEMSGDNHIVGLFNKDALIWDASEEAYFMDEDYGYGTYQGKTFRYNIVDNEIKNAQYITDLGGNAEDHGLFSPLTVDDLAERRISNYNVQGITQDELNYLEKDCRPLKDNPNKYQITPKQSKWLFNMIGHTQLWGNPSFFLKSDKIYVEVTPSGLEIDLIVTNTYSGIRACKATVNKIGETTIPGMDAFMKNPDFNGAISALEVMQKAINTNHYDINSSQFNDGVIINPDYIYGASFTNNQINLKANNKLNKQPGYYQISVDALNGVEVLEPTASAYLTDFPLFKDMAQYFVISPLANKQYIYTLDNRAKEAKVDDFINLYAPMENINVITNITLDAIIIGQDLKQLTITLNSNDGMEAVLHLASLNTANNPIIDEFIATLY